MQYNFHVAPHFRSLLEHLYDSLFFCVAGQREEGKFETDEAFFAKFALEAFFPFSLSFLLFTLGRREVEDVAACDCKCNLALAVSPVYGY